MAAEMEMPKFASSNYGTASAYNLAQLLAVNVVDVPAAAAMRQSGLMLKPNPEAVMAAERSPMSKCRVVRIFIADPDENVPVEQRVLYKSEEKITDATDNELFFEVDVRELLAKHNEMRVTLKDKKVKDREEKLEPARIRDLKMTVVTIAEF